MKIRKSMLLLTLMLALSFVLQACGNSSASPETSSAADETEPVTETLQTEEPVINTGDGNILIAYFYVMETDNTDTVAGASRVAVDGEVLGNNEYLAQIIQRETGGDLFAIKTVQDYPTTHDPLLEFAYNEKADNARPELATQIENFDSYDLIFLGYPNMEQGFESVLCV